MEFNESKLSEATSLITKGATPTTYGFEFVSPSDESISFYRGNNCTAGCYFNDDDVKSITKEANEYLKRSKLSCDDILICIVGSVGNTCMIDETMLPGNINQNVALIRCEKNKLNPSFFKHVVCSEILRKQIRREAATQAQPSLSLKQVGDFKTPLPPLSEQKKIARILSTWDKAIETVDKLIENSQQQKKALMQQLLTGKKRLPGFSGEWKEVRLREIFQPVTRKNTKNIGLVLTVSGENGLVDQTTYFNRKVAADCLDSYYHLKKGEFAYNRSSMKGYPFGSIKRLEKHENGVVSTLYMCFKLKNTVNSADFYSHYFEYGLANKELYKVTQVGARAHGLLNISKGDFFDIKILCPPEDEQQSIANALDTMDAVLLNNKHQKKLLLFQKMALMQQLLTGKRRVTIDDMDNANG